jgi:preprotein translocase subunit YajC
MDAQSATHFAIIVLVVLCNLFYFSLRRAGRRHAEP